jgi:hypothetical protein
MYLNGIANNGALVRKSFSCISELASLYDDPEVKECDTVCFRAEIDGNVLFGDTPLTVRLTDGVKLKQGEYSRNVFRQLLEHQLSVPVAV